MCSRARNGEKKTRGRYEAQEMQTCWDMKQQMKGKRRGYKGRKRYGEEERNSERDREIAEKRRGNSARRGSN